MPEDTTEVEDDQAINAGHLRRQLEAEQAKTKTLEDVNRTLAREVAFGGAGLPDSPQTKFFREHYAGEPTAEAIRAAATAAGFLETGATAAETAVLANIEAAVTGAEKPPAAGTDDAVLEELAKVDGRSQTIYTDIEAILRRSGHKVEADYR